VCTKRLFIIVGMILVKSTIPISSLGGTIVSFLINFCREIVVDDMQISKVQTFPPTHSPTFAITAAEEDEATGTPSHSVSFSSLLLILFQPSNRKMNSSHVSSNNTQFHAANIMPTVSTITSCPSAFYVSTEVPSGPVMLALSSSLCG
jgi:hypothetical protein